MTPTLRRGDESEAVRSWQVLLNTRRLARLRADGVFGPVTEAATRRAQRCLGIDPSGTVSPDLADRVRSYRPEGAAA